MMELSKTQQIIQEIYNTDSLGLEELTGDLDIPKSKVLKIINKLRREGMLEIDGDTIQPNHSRIREKYVRINCDICKKRIIKDEDELTCDNCGHIVCGKCSTKTDTGVVCKNC